MRYVLSTPQAEFLRRIRVPSFQGCPPASAGQPPLAAAPRSSRGAHRTVRPRRSRSIWSKLVNHLF